jgi:DNA-binding NarL/FixJ family response regulator
MMPVSPDTPNTSVLLIDSSMNQRTHWADELKRVSPDYLIVEAHDRESGLALYRSRRFDCVVLELSLPDQSGFPTLMALVPRASRPRIAVIVLTVMTHPGVSELAKHHGAYACLQKQVTTGEDLDKAIRRGVAFIGQMPKEDRYRP